MDSIPTLLSLLKGYCLDGGGETENTPSQLRIRALSKEVSKREQPALRELRKRVKPEELINHFSHLIRKGKEDICQRDKNIFRKINANGIALPFSVRLPKLKLAGW